jgi:hypothetical protein
MSAPQETQPKVEKKAKAPKAPKSKEAGSAYPLEVNKKKMEKKTRIIIFSHPE